MYVVWAVLTGVIVRTMIRALLVFSAWAALALLAAGHSCWGSVRTWPRVAHAALQFFFRNTRIAASSGKLTWNAWIVQTAASGAAHSWA